MPRYVVLEKPVGLTPLEAIERWKDTHSAYRDAKASYAGRLDPMASGKLLVLLGEECKKQGAYTALDKKYEVEVLLDVSTDTGDMLGIPAYTGKETYPASAEVAAALAGVTGTHTLPYPAFSSKTVAGKPLFMYALEGTLSTIEIPLHEETIHRIQLTERYSLTTDELQARIMTGLTHVPRSDEPSKVLGADFRQDEIRKRWQQLLVAHQERTFDVLRIQVICASSTYMRTLAGRLAKTFDTEGLALSIHRTRIGTYRQIGQFGFWTRSY